MSARTGARSSAARARRGDPQRRERGPGKLDVLEQQEPRHHHTQDRSLTTRSTRYRSPGDVLLCLNPVLRGWCACFR